MPDCLIRVFWSTALTFRSRQTTQACLHSSLQKHSTLVSLSPKPFNMGSISRTFHRNMQSILILHFPRNVSCISRDNLKHMSDDILRVASILLLGMPADKKENPNVVTQIKLTSKLSWVTGHIINGLPVWYTMTNTLQPCWNILSQQTQLFMNLTGVNCHVFTNPIHPLQ